MYVKKTILLLILLVNVCLCAYIIVDNRAVFADSALDPLEGTRLDATFDLVPLAAAPAPPGNAEGWETFEATAYCNFGITQSGVWVRRGIIAVDPALIPIGSIIELKAGRYSGIYTAMDTGACIQGRLVDVYVSSYDEALRFGRRPVQLRLLRRGWNPAGAPGALPPSTPAAVSP
jgi:3D (Asp-Asp-Asp) domain-containing protein